MPRNFHYTDLDTLELRTIRLESHREIDDLLEGSSIDFYINYLDTIEQ